ncbi:MAG: D-alanyl-D-alanine carboxypeptidase family protein, partial [Acetivibrionales bacterium]
LKDLMMATTIDEQLKKDFDSKFNTLDHDKPSKDLKDAIREARILEGELEGNTSQERGFDPDKDYATLIADAIKVGNYSNLQKYVNERDAKIASDIEKYKDAQTTGAYLLFLGYVSVREYLNRKGYANDQITYENGKVCVTVNGKKYPLGIAGIALTGYTNYASKENIDKALSQANIPDSGGETGTGTINPPPAQCDTVEKKAQYYLSQLGFYIGVDDNGNPDIDGSWGNHSITATILFQYSMGITVTGKCDQTTMNKLVEAANKNMEYDSIIKKFNPSDLPPVKGENGKLDITKLIAVKTNDKDNAYLTKETAVAWAYLIDAARRDGQDYRQLYPSHYDSGYRDYATQKTKYRDLGPGTAAYPGTSNHGFGIAIDFSTTRRGGQARYHEGTTDMMIWLEDNAKNFGFEPLLYDDTKPEDHPKYGPPTKWSDKRQKEVNNYYESWHWNYKG